MMQVVLKQVFKVRQKTHFGKTFGKLSAFGQTVS